MKTRSEVITELADFLRDLPVHRMTAEAIAARLYDAGWRKPGDQNRGVQIGDGNIQNNVF